MEAISTPTKRNQNSVYNMIYQTQSLVPSEAEWIRQRADLAAVGHGAEDRLFTGVIEGVLNKLSGRLSMVSSAAENISVRTTVLYFRL